MQRYNFEIFADYFMIYLCDDGLLPDMPTDVTNDDVDRRLRVEPHIMVIHTGRNMDVPVAVKIYKKAPVLDLTAGDHITECSLEVPSARLVLGGTTGYLPDYPRIVLPAAGTYRIRTVHAGLDTIEGLDGDDRYTFEIWPAPFAEWRVLKFH